MAELDKYHNEVIENACFRMDESLRMVKMALSKISESQIWTKPNNSLNSIGNLLLHLCGNMRQYGIASLQNTEDTRHRALEFSIDGGFTKVELLNQLEATVNEVKSSFNTISKERMVSKQSVQGFTLSGLGNLIHVVEHFSYHTGQIALLTKLITDEQLGFYKDQDLNTKNEN